MQSIWIKCWAIKPVSLVTGHPYYSLTVDQLSTCGCWRVVPAAADQSERRTCVCVYALRPGHYDIDATRFIRGACLWMDNCGIERT